MKQRFRLKRRQDFDRVMHARRVFAGQALVAFARPNEAGRWRVGVAVSRRLRGPVLRNRLRRRLREAARACLLPPAPAASERPARPGYDVVLVARPGAAELPMSVLQREAERVRSRLAEPGP